MANILEKLGKAEEANRLRKQALTIGTVSELQRASFSKFRAKDFKGGLKILKNVLKNSPNNYQSYTAMAWGYTQANDSKSAKKMYKKALKMAPKDRIDAIKNAMAKLK